MNLSTFSMLFLVILRTSYSLITIEEKICKVICSISNLKDADIFKGSLTNPIKLSINLLKECNIKFRILSDMKIIGKINLISFAYEGKVNKVSNFENMYDILDSNYFKR